MISIYNLNCHLYALYLPPDSSSLPLNPFPRTFKLSLTMVPVLSESLGSIVTKEQNHTNAQRGTKYNYPLNFDAGVVMKEGVFVSK